MYCDIPNYGLRAYAFFWMITIFPWVGIAARYFMFVGGVNNYDLYLLNERLLQLFIFASGIPLFAFLSLLLFKSGRAFLLMLAVSLAGFFTAAWIMWQPDGFAPGPLTDFTVDPTLNFNALLVFGLLAGTAFVLLLFHSVSNIYKRLFDPAAKISYTAWYSLALVVYVGLGSIDKIKAVTGWPIVAFRVLYAAAFLFAYLITVIDEARQDEYLVLAKH